MPRDDWAKARAKDVAKRRQRKRGRHHTIKPIKTGAYSEETKLWFGKHKDKPLKDVPESYLRWLVSLPPSASWQINALCEHLRKTCIYTTR